MAGDSADALSAALLGAIKRVVEEGQSAGLELLATLDATLTDKVRVPLLALEGSIADFTRFVNTLSAKLSTHPLFSISQVSKQKNLSKPRQHWFRNT